MSQANEENQSNEFKNDASSSRVRNGSELDKAFPSTWTFGFIVIMVIVLSLITGWKVVNLGLEKAELERDLKANKAIREELPILENKKNDLRKAINNLKNSNDSERLKFFGLKKENEDLKKENEDVQNNLRDMNLKFKSQESELRQTEDSYAELQGKIIEAKHELGRLVPKVKIEKNVEKALRLNIFKVKSEIEDLEIKEEGLKRRKENLQIERDRILQDLESLKEDRGRLQELSKIFKNVADDMERSGANIDNESKRLARVTNDVEAEKENLLRAANSMNSKSKEIELAVKQIEDIQGVFKTAQSDLNKSISESQSQIRALKELKNKEAIQFEKNIKKSDANIDGFQANVQGIQRVTNKYEENLKSLKDKIKVAEQTSNSMKSLESSLMKLQNKISSNADNFDGLFTQVNDQFNSFNRNLDRTLDQVNDKYKKADKDLAQLISRSKENYKNIDDQNQRVEKKLKEVDGKVKEKLGWLDKKIQEIQEIFKKSKN